MNGITDKAEASRPPALDNLQILVELLLQRCRQGDREALPEFRAVLDQHPEIWRRYGDLAVRAETAWVDRISGTDDGMRECVLRKVRELKAELGGASPSPMARLLVERVTACWLQLHDAEARAAQAEGQSLKQAEFALKRQDRAHRHYLAAIGALATFKKLMPCSATSPLPLEDASSTSGRGLDLEAIRQGIPGPHSTSAVEGPLLKLRGDGPIEIAPQESECPLEPGNCHRMG